MAKINLGAIKKRAKRATERNKGVADDGRGPCLTNRYDLRPYAVKMLGPRNHWPSITDHVYACLIEQFCDAASEAVAIHAADTLAVVDEVKRLRKFVKVSP